MKTTELIKILQDNEKGGISHKPRNISLSINGRYMPNPQISLSSTGDGICGPEIDLDIEGDWLEQQPSEDCISRQAVDELSKGLVHTTRDKADFLCNFWEGLRKLSSATPRQKKGKWDFEGAQMFRCTSCKTMYLQGQLEGLRNYKYDPEFPNYCPNCGAKMEVDADDE